MIAVDDAVTLEQEYKNDGYGDRARDRGEIEGGPEEPLGPQEPVVDQIGQPQGERCLERHGEQEEIEVVTDRGGEVGLVQAGPGYECAVIVRPTNWTLWLKGLVRPDQLVKLTYSARNIGTTIKRTRMATEGETKSQPNRFSPRCSRDLPLLAWPGAALGAAWGRPLSSREWLRALRFGELSPSVPPTEVRAGAVVPGQSARVPRAVGAV